MKFVHIADLHLDSPFTTISDRADLGMQRRLEQREALKKVVDFIKENEIEYLFISGDLYEQEYVGDMESAKDTTVEDSIDEIISLLDTSEKVLNLLSNNQDTWNVEGDNIVFSNDSIRNQYDELINSIG